MPTYVYEAVNADGEVARRFEVRQSMRDAPLTRDPLDGLPVHRVISGGIEIPRAPADVRRKPVCTNTSACPCCG